MENFVGKLNELVHRRGLELKYEEVGSVGPDHIKTFTIRAVLNGKACPDGVGKTKKEAKQNAARNALRGLWEEAADSDIKTNQQTEDLNHSLSGVIDQTKSLSVKTEDSFTETNFIVIVNEYCQRKHCSRTFIEESRCGPAHDPQFFYKLIIDNKEYPVGEGKSVKEAKQHAAQLAWSALQEQSDRDSKGTSLSTVSDDGAPPKVSTAPSTPDSGLDKSRSLTTTASDSVVSSSPSLPPEEQVQTPDVKPKIRIAANFHNAPRNSKEIIINFKDKNTGKSQKTPTQSIHSRFTAEFESISGLGKGAFGHVFKAKQKLLKKFFAVKIVCCKEKSLREVSALSELHHNNIVRYYTCWMEDSDFQWDSTADSCSTSQSSSDSPVKFLYIQMELCDTKTLRVWIDEKNIQNVKKSLRDSKRREESLSITKQIVSGVEYIHSKMLIHRDLKPANILFSQDGEVKIGDFGLVTAENNGDTEDLMERSVRRGTPSYMAPEQKSKSTYDRKVDIFALGLIYFELLWNLSTGHERQVIWGEARDQKLPQGFSHHFHQENQIIKSLLCVKPEDRPEASKLKTDLEELQCSLIMIKNTLHDRTV